MRYNTQCDFKYNDGGRAAAGYKGKTGDCGIRAIAIVTGKPYQEVCDMITELVNTGKGFTQRKTKRQSGIRTGVWQQDVKKIMLQLGWQWKPTMHIGQGCTVHLLKNELPAGKLLCNVSRHYTAVIDGTIHDTYNTARQGTRCVYGYYYQPEPATPAPAVQEPATPAPAVQEPATPAPAVTAKLNKLLAAQKKWQSKAKRAETALAKLAKKIKYYQKRSKVGTILA